ncbi:MAG: archease [Anaerolineae bacterium]|nr:archease [Anaerolineae bacterium]
MGHWQEIDHTADLALHIWAEDLEDLFTTAARGMFTLIADMRAINMTHTITLTLEAPDLEILLVDWLNELLFFDEVEGIAYVTFVFDELTPTRLQASLRGGVIMEHLNYVKAATFHNLVVRHTETGYETEMVFDT